LEALRTHLSIKKFKSKHKRLFNKLKKLKQKELVNTSSDVLKHMKHKQPKEKTLESLMKLNDNPINKLETILVRSWPPSVQFQASLDEEHKLYQKYQTSIHKDTSDECSLEQFDRFLCKSPLTSSNYSGPVKTAKKKFYKDILNTDILNSSDDLDYGSFHYQYRINGKLIAVGVIDILDKCISSVYFFYDPDYQFLRLGTYSALRLAFDLTFFKTLFNFYE
jgi:arginyl-tRNA---protein transferase